MESLIKSYITIKKEIKSCYKVRKEISNIIKMPAKD